MFHDSRLTLKHTFALELRRLKFGRPKQRVFCVGFQKTGTTSLQYALSLMGYRVAGVFRTRHLETIDQIREEALHLAQKFDAVGDNPWPLFYKELDEAFPNSKFILTIRNPDEWHKSATKHFGSQQRRMHQIIYGASAPEGNRDLYVDRMEAHNQTVRDHFKERPDDFLEFSLERGDGWDEVCEFLEKPVPKRPFPRLNTAKMRA